MFLFLTVARGRTLQDSHPILTISDPALIEQMLREIPYVAEYGPVEWEDRRDAPSKRSRVGDSSGDRSSGPV